VAVSMFIRVIKYVNINDIMTMQKSLIKTQL